MKIFSKRIYYAWHRGSTSGRHRFESRRSLFFFFFFLYITVIAWIADQRRGSLLCSRESQKMNGCKRSVSWRPDLNALCPDDLTWVLFFSFIFLFHFALASSVRDQSGVSDWAKGQWVEVAGSLSASGAKSNHYAVYVNKETTRTFDSSFYVL